MAKYFVVFPYLGLVRNGNLPDSPPQSSVPQLHVERFDKREDAVYYKKDAEKHNPPGTVMCFEGNIEGMRM